MMGGRSWDDWIDEYALAHQHPVNKFTHAIGIPMIAISILLVPTCLFVTGTWRIALMLFVIGWILQFVGHYFEGKPPEFMKDRRFLLVGLRWWFKKVLGVEFGS
ncbi:MAG: DUF962 domain-containing protein [Pyrinomonadaceae bacterium]